MRLPSIFNTHPRSDLAACADGQLSPRRRDTIASHLASCERCSAELEALLNVRTALQDLPQTSAPRSFALTPAMAGQQRAAPQPRGVPAYMAMRVAGAGFAAVLALVVMLDAGGVVNDSGGPDDSQTSLGFLNIDGESATDAADYYADRSADADDGKEINAASGGDELPRAGGGDTGAPESQPTAGAGEEPPAPGTAGDSVEPTVGAGGGVGGPSGSTDVPSADSGNDVVPPDEQSDDMQSTENGGQDAPAGGVTDTDDGEDNGGARDEAAQPEANDGAEAFSTTDDDGGSDTLLVVEIALAAVAVIAVGGSFALRRAFERER